MVVAQMIGSSEREIIRRCVESAVWFISNFLKIKHPSAGIIPFKPHDYQRRAIGCFRKHRRNIFRKTRQAGVSKIAGAFALWLAMFFAHKTVLIVSRRDEDAKGFLADNIRLPFRHLPDWMQDIWLPSSAKLADNEHTLQFTNGSVIKSLTSHPDVLRSNASSLNIIDECGFIPDMDVMWSAAWPTLQHGGSCICITTPNGIGNWYWNTWTDAEAKLNDFNPITIEWWDMKWRIEYVDAISGEKCVIAPTEGIRECTTKAERDKYGKYWSPWLEEQYRALQEKGEGWKFEQEILAVFLGSGNTVLPKAVLQHLADMISDSHQMVTGPQVYVHPTTSEQEIIDFTPTEPQQGLWVWAPPITATPDKYVGDVIVEQGRTAHAYVLGVDTATGKGRDYHGIEILDVSILEQAAELMLRCPPKMLTKIVDRLGRWYNNALVVFERNNGGDHMIDDLHDDFAYPRLWRRVRTVDRPNAKSTKTYDAYGYFTSNASKPALNKCMLDALKEADGQGGYRIYSRRLVKQLNTYVRKRDRSGRDTNKTEAESGPTNFDDLVMALGLALIGAPDAGLLDVTGIAPISTTGLQLMAQSPVLELSLDAPQRQQMLMPIAIAPDQPPEESALEEMLKFAKQLGGLPVTMQQHIQPAVVKRRHQL